jgi:alpha-1,3-mannosyltransferase
MITKLLLADLLLSIVVIAVEPTYVFDWDAYMEQVAQVWSGEFDYVHLHGDTGPLVYPAGFVWLFMLLKAIFQWDHKLYTTEYIPKNFTGYEDRTIRPLGRMLALQTLFTVMYLCGNGIIGSLYQRSKTMPWWSIMLLMSSRRIHSIFVLGLFNDCCATFLLIVALYYLVKDRWEVGCIFFSLAVSIKMNVLLFAPSLLVLMCQRYNLQRAVHLIGICALVQGILALPFLATHPFHYIAGAFDLSRQFFQEWSVNWQFLPEWLFLHKAWALLLLAGQLGTLYMFAEHRWTDNQGIVGLFRQPARQHRNKPLDIEHILTVMLTGNFVGIVFCRSLHYQFYSWYFFSIPYLLWRTELHTAVKIASLLLMEVAWNEHPPAIWSSALLQSVHGVVLIALWKSTKYGEVRGVGGGLPPVD